MKRIGSYLLTALGLMFVSSLAFAAEGGAETAGITKGLIAIGSGLAIGMGAFGAATGQGRATSSAVEGVARNPSSQELVFKTLFLPLIFMELQALFALVIAFLWYNSAA